MHSILSWRFCKRCKLPYDIGTNYELCPMCRRKKEVIEDGNRSRNN